MLWPVRGGTAGGVPLRMLTRRTRRAGGVGVDVVVVTDGVRADGFGVDGAGVVVGEVGMDGAGGEEV